VTDDPWDDPLPAAPQVELSEETDVAVVGGGLAGVCCARLLAAAGARVTLLEAASELGRGGSGASAGLAMTGLVEHPHRLASALGDDATRALLAFGRSGVDKLAELAPFRREGLCWIALEERERSEIERSAETLDRLGVPVRAIEPRDVGIEAAAAGLWITGDGAIDQPRAAVRAIAQAAIDAGATIVTGAAVDEIADEGDGLHLKIGARGLRAEVVVYAGDHGLATLDATFEDKLVPVREEALVADGPAPPVPMRAGYGYSFVRAIGSDRVLFGGCRWAAPSMGVGTVDTRPPDGRVQGRIEAQLRRHLPAAREIVTRWAWIDTHTCDGLPIVGPLPGSARRIACTGFCGNDWGLATAAAAAVTEGLLGKGQPDIPSILAASRFV